jgi:hypothetical protein
VSQRQPSQLGTRVRSLADSAGANTTDTRASRTRETGQSDGDDPGTGHATEKPSSGTGTDEQ